MPRARSRQELAVSLFPFLSVLACVIGTLTLIISALALGQVASELSQEPEPAESHQAFQSQQAAVRALEEQLVAARTAEAELPLARQALAALGVRPEDPAVLRRRAVRTRVEAARLARRVAELEKSRRELESSAGLVRVEIDAQREPQPQGLITIQPRGSGAPLQPFFVECRANAVLVHKHEEDWSIPLRLDDRDDARRFDVFLRGVRSTPSSTVIFLIRPDGVGSYVKARRRAARHFVRHGKLPLPGEGELDFHLF